MKKHLKLCLMLLLSLSLMACSADPNDAALDAAKFIEAQTKTVKEGKFSKDAWDKGAKSLKEPFAAWIKMIEEKYGSDAEPENIKGDDKAAYDAFMKAFMGLSDAIGELEDGDKRAAAISAMGDFTPASSE